MIEKIISGGQTGADRAALDVAIESGIRHGGWIPKGRKTEDGILPDKYQLKEMPTAGYPPRTEKNILDSDGTLIICHGKLTGGSALTRKMAKKHDRPWLHVDVDKTNGFEAARTVISWIIQHGIEVLNVAGTRASKDPEIYQNTMSILKTILYLGIVQDNMPDLFPAPSQTKNRLNRLHSPRTVDEAMDRLISEMPLKDKVFLANMEEEDLISLHPTLGKYIRDKFGLWSGNEELMESCRSLLREEKIHEDSASLLIIEELQRKLRETHVLRPLK